MKPLHALYVRAGSAVHDGGAVLRRLVRDNRAVSVIEYAILLGVIVAATAVATVQFGEQIEGAINTIASNVTRTVSDVGRT